MATRVVRDVGVLDWRQRARAQLDAHYSEIKARVPPSYLAVLPVVLLQQLALGLARGVLPTMYERQLGRAAATLDAAVLLLKGLLALAACPLIGALSDRWGRRPLLLASVLGSGLPLFVGALAPAPSASIVGDIARELPRGDHDSMHAAGGGAPSALLYLLFDAVSGFFAATNAVASAYVADVAVPAAALSASAARRALRTRAREAAVRAVRRAAAGGADRSAQRAAAAAAAELAIRTAPLPARVTVVGALGVVMASFGFALAVAPTAAKLLLTLRLAHVPPERLPFAAGATLVLLNAMYVARALPESRELPEDGDYALTRGSDVWRAMRTIGAGGAMAPLRRVFCGGLAAAAGDGGGASGSAAAARKLRVLSALVLLFCCNTWGVTDSMERFVAESGAALTRGALSAVLGGVGLAIMLSQAVLVPRLGRRAGSRQLALWSVMGAAAHAAVVGLGGAAGLRGRAERLLLLISAPLLLFSHMLRPAAAALAAQAAVEGAAGAVGATSGSGLGGIGSDSGGEEGAGEASGAAGGAEARDRGDRGFVRSGEALGVVHGVFVLTEALGPLLFGALLSWYSMPPHHPHTAFVVGGTALLPPSLFLALRLVSPAAEEAGLALRTPHGLGIGIGIDDLGGDAGGADGGRGGSGGCGGAADAADAAGAAPDTALVVAAAENALALRYGATLSSSAGLGGAAGDGRVPAAAAVRAVGDVDEFSGGAACDTSEQDPFAVGGGAAAGDDDGGYVAADQLQGYDGGQWVTGGYELGSPTKSSTLVNDSVFD